MRKTQSRAKRALLGRVLVGGALLVVMIVATACGAAPSAPPATPVAEVTPSAATQPAPQATTGTGPSAPAGTAEPGSQEPGASAALNPAAKYTTHYKGDPNAPVVLIEVSDFQ